MSGDDESTPAQPEPKRPSAARAAIHDKSAFADQERRWGLRKLIAMPNPDDEHLERILVSLFGMQSFAEELRAMPEDQENLSRAAVLTILDRLLSPVMSDPSPAPVKKSRSKARAEAASARTKTAQ